MLHSGYLLPVSFQCFGALAETANGMSMRNLTGFETFNMAAESNIRKSKSLGIVEREGARENGRWVVKTILYVKSFSARN